MIEHFDIRRCNECGYAFAKFDDGMVFLIPSTELLDVRSDLHFVIKSFFSRAEEYFMNPIFVNGQTTFDYMKGEGTCRIRFIEGVYCCPRCDNVEVLDAFDRNNSATFNDFIKALMHERKYK